MLHFSSALVRALKHVAMCTEHIADGHQPEETDYELPLSPVDTFVLHALSLSSSFVLGLIAHKHFTILAAFRRCCCKSHTATEEMCSLSPQTLVGVGIGHAFVCVRSL